MKKFFVLGVVLTVFSTVTVAAAPPDVPVEIVNAFQRAGVRLLDAKAPIIDFNLRRSGGAGNIRLSDLRGKVVFLNFWATWCPPCRSEMPSMEKLYLRFKDRGLEMVAVDIAESERDVVTFMNTFKLTFPAALDTDRRIGSTYGIRYFPTTYIIGRDGQIIISFIGGRTWDTPELIAAFDALLRHGQ